MTVVAKSVDDDCPELSVVARRGYGGLAIFWKKEIDDKIKVIDEGNNRCAEPFISPHITISCVFLYFSITSDSCDIISVYSQCISLLPDGIYTLIRHIGDALVTITESHQDK
jgi:hypothetical protein